MVSDSVAKRSLDICLASMLLLVSSPLLAIVSLSLWLTQGAPVFFTQMRPGRNEVPFRLYKFRTMSIGSESHSPPRTDEERLTRIGRFLRSWGMCFVAT